MKHVSRKNRVDHSDRLSTGYPHGLILEDIGPDACGTSLGARREGQIGKLSQKISTRT